MNYIQCLLFGGNWRKFGILNNIKKIMKIENKILLITGGTGSFGISVLNRFLDTDHFKYQNMISRKNDHQSSEYSLQNISTRSSSTILICKSRK